jgi:hypothetical protein
MLETVKTYIFGEWQVIGQAPVSFVMAFLAIGVLIWIASNWAYGAVIANQSSEIRLLERQNKDWEKQVDALQKKPGSAISDYLVDSADLVLQIYEDERLPLVCHSIIFGGGII